jgi:hypothetical protein
LSFPKQIGTKSRSVVILSLPKCIILNNIIYVGGNNSRNLEGCGMEISFSCKTIFYSINNRLNFNSENAGVYIEGDCELGGKLVIDKSLIISGSVTVDNFPTVLVLDPSHCISINSLINCTFEGVLFSLENLTNLTSCF